MTYELKRFEYLYKKPKLLFHQLFDAFFFFKSITWTNNWKQMRVQTRQSWTRVKGLCNKIKIRGKKGKKQNKFILPTCLWTFADQNISRMGICMEETTLQYHLPICYSQTFKDLPAITELKCMDLLFWKKRATERPIIE